jgi:hypothetical protein
MPLGMTALEIVLFVTPRVFLFVAGPVRIQKIRVKPKVRSILNDAPLNSTSKACLPPHAT